MIDFRYHLVSLISVFLALAVGIVLGAGPLKEAIGDQLTGQVETLRADKESLRKEVDTLGADLATRDAFIAATAPQLTAGTIPGRRVALVELDDVADDVVDGVVAQLTSAGATLAGTVSLSDKWTSEGQARYRQALVPSLASYLPEGASGGSPDADLARALVLSLVQLAPDDDGAFSSDAVQVQKLLSAGEFVTYPDDLAPADMIVVLSQGVEAGDEPSPTSGTQAETTLLISQELPLAAQQLAESAVLVGVGASPLVAAVATGDDKGTVSTVSDVRAVTGQVSVPLALSARAAGTVGHFGTGDGATGLVPTVVRLAEVDRAPRRAVVPEAPATTDEETPDAETDADAEGDAEGADAEGDDAAGDEG